MGGEGPEEGPGSQTARLPGGRRTVMMLALALLGVAAVVVLLRSPLFALESVHVRGVDRLSPEEVAAAVPVSWGEPVWSVDRHAVARAVEELPRVEQAQVTLLLPNRLEVSVRERLPAAVVAGPGLWEVGDDGRILGQAESRDQHRDLPVITGLGDSVPEPGQLWLDDGLLAAVAFLAVEDDRLIEVISEIHVATRPEQLTLYTRAGIEVRLPARPLQPQEAEERLLTLVAVLAELEAEDVAVRYVDLRFAGRPVVAPVAPQQLPEGDAPSEAVNGAEEMP